MEISTIHYKLGGNSEQSSSQTYYAHIFRAYFLVLHHLPTTFDAHDNVLQTFNVDGNQQAIF